MQIAVLLFDRVTALEAVVPYEVLGRLPSAQVTFVGERVGPVRSDTGRLALVVDAVLDEVPRPDVLVVPGGAGRDRHMGNGIVHRWLRAASLTAAWTVAVGTGSLILASAGLLRGRRAAAISRPDTVELASCGAVPIPEALVLDEPFATAAGSASALELAVQLAERIGGPGAASTISDRLVLGPPRRS